MRAALILFVLLTPFLARAEEEKKPKKDPIKELPSSLQPGTKAGYARAAGGDRLKGTVTFAVTKGDAAGTVKIVREYATGKAGPLEMRDRLTAVLDAKSRRIVSFTYDLGKKKDDPYVTASRLSPHPEKKGSLLFERLTYRKKGEDPRVKKTRVKIEGDWTPDLLEPFLVTLHTVEEEKDRTLTILNTLSGQVSRKLSSYRALGRGSLKVGKKKKVACRILSRTRDGAMTTLYLRATDGLPMKGSAFFLTVKPEDVK